MQDQPQVPNSETNAQNQIGFLMPPGVSELVSEWWFWWRFFRAGMQLLANGLRRIDRGSRWYLFIDVTPGPNAKDSRKIILRKAIPGTAIWRYVKNRMILWTRLEEPTFSFRFRFNRCAHVTVDIDSLECVLAQPSPKQAVVLASADRKTAIKDASTLVLKSDGWPTEEAARANGKRYSNVLKRALAKLRIGANYGEFGPKGNITRAGTVHFEEMYGERILNDVHGLMVYPSLPEPRFGKISVTPVVGKQQSQFVTAVKTATDVGKEFDEQEKLAFELFNASNFQETENTRLILLVMAIESLLVSEPRSANARDHIRDLMRQTKTSDQLSDEERQAVLGPLGRLMSESIKQSGRRFCEQRLGNREYEGQTASKFFASCYDLRSRLVHGQSSPEDHRKIGHVVGQLEVFLSDLLSTPLELNKE